MAVDKNKVIAEATKLVQKGQFDKAIRAYEKLLADDGKDVRILLKVGELQQKKGDNASAAQTFSRVADAYGEQGFFLKAVAVYKQMLKLAPDDVRVNERLANLYQQLGILSDAMAQLQLVASVAEKSGDEAKLFAVLQRMVELDPDNVGSAVKLGELYAKQSQPKLALDHLRRAAEQLKKNNRADEYIKVAERIAFLAPGDLALTRELANLYLAKGDTKRALAKLQLCFKADPKDVDTLTLLAQAFKDLGQVSKTVSVYRELGHLYADKGRVEEARTTWRRILELAPGDAEATQEVSPARPSPPPPAARPPPRAAVPPSVAQRPVVAPPPIPPPPAPAAAPAPTAPASARAGHGQEAIAKLVTETDVYMKYGLHEKALEHLKKVLALDPDNLEAHEKTLQLRALRKDAAGAAEAAVRAARIALARGLEDRARAAMDRLREIAPDHPELAALGGAVHPAIEEEVVVLDGEEDLILEVEPPAEEVDDIAIAAAGSPVDEIVDEEPAVAIVAAPPAAPPAPSAGVSPAKPPVPVVAPPRAVPASPVPASAAPPRAEPPRAAPSRAEPPRAAPSRAEPPRVAPTRATPPRVAPSVPVASVPTASIPIASAPPPARVPPPPPPPYEGEEDLEDELAEIEFFIQQGLHYEAHEALQNLLAFYPAHLKVRARLTELERTLAPPPAAVLPEPPVEETFDIARELAEELGTSSSALPATDEFQYSVADVFSQFKKGVAETVKAEDSATHYDLGIAYKEMGLLDDALHEFEVAMSGKARKKEIDCLTMIAMCRTEKGDAAGAIQAYQRALRSDYVTPEAARAVHYEIAVAYEVAGDPEAALFYLQRVLKADAGYRDAKAIVARLGGGPGRQPPSAGNPRPAQNESSAPGADRNGPKKNIGFV